ncbi:hypothetical protein AEQ67_13510 [Pseudomonas sp. RIT-PI-q]|uniref:hypothetical protein n=1 Tax=Pseudomonas sp. RIT-PI-q TaxID=1690247 RepID=UPI0006CD5A94|nr:hypothetical protein [Pseudomonas sp. RIT-PI-q]KPG98364.1 hypothetical protein AEQ67_13510 [Pseudomonas sp. RIT-PI-q]
MTSNSELQGEISALCCLVVALASTLPLSSQLRLWPEFEQIANPLRALLESDELRGFERATVSLASRRKLIG